MINGHISICEVRAKATSTPPYHRSGEAYQQCRHFFLGRKRNCLKRNLQCGITRYDTFPSIISAFGSIHLDWKCILNLLPMRQLLASLACDVTDLQNYKLIHLKKPLIDRIVSALVLVMRSSTRICTLWAFSSFAMRYEISLIPDSQSRHYSDSK